jgi:hypothetical protein
VKSRSLRNKNRFRFSGGDVTGSQNAVSQLERPPEIPMSPADGRAPYPLLAPLTVGDWSGGEFTVDKTSRLDHMTMSSTNPIDLQLNPSSQV